MAACTTAVLHKLLSRCILRLNVLFCLRSDKVDQAGPLTVQRCKWLLRMKAGGTTRGGDGMFCVEVESAAMIHRKVQSAKGRISVDTRRAIAARAGRRKRITW